MSELTQEERLARTKRRMIYLKVALVIAAIIIIFSLWKGCQNSKSANEAYRAIRDTLQSVLQDTARIQGEARRLKYENNDLDLHIADLVADLQQTRAVLIDESDKSKRLALEVKKARADKDTVEYFRHCDSLAEVNLWLNSVYNTEKWKSNQLDSLYTKILQNKDSITAIWQKAYNECVRAAEFAVTELPKIKPKGKVYFDITAITGPLTAVGGGLGYLDKNGRMINADILISPQGPIYQLRLAAPLSLKRK